MSRVLMLMLVFCSFHPTAWSAGSVDLLSAIRNGDHARVDKLVREGADVNGADEDGTTALMHAVIESDIKMMKLLIDRGAKVNAKNGMGSTALLYSVTNLPKAKLLLDAGADVKVKNVRNATPMSIALTAFGSTPILKLLSAKGAETQDSLMTSAAQKGDLDVRRSSEAFRTPSSTPSVDRPPFSRPRSYALPLVR